MPAAQIVFASSHAEKIKEIQTLLKPYDIQVLTLKDIDVPMMKETGKTFTDNALLKATAASKVSGLPALADDSGLCVHALKNEPGIYSTRYAQKCRGYKRAFDDILKRLTDNKDKTAHFECALAYVFPNGQQKIFTGRVDGMIVPPLGDKGYGYDPIFLPEGQFKTFGEMTPTEKIAISHRGKAISAFLKEFN